MTHEWTAPAWVVLTALAVIGLLGAAVAFALRSRTRRLIGRSDLLERRLVEVERRLADPTPAPTPAPMRRDEPIDYVITRIGDEGDRAELAVPAPDRPAPVVPAAVFADIVLRESVVASASLVHGLRRALAPEVRNRIRFEMRREVKRARKARRAEQRQAVRAWQSRQRAADTGVTDAGEDAA